METKKFNDTEAAYIDIANSPDVQPHAIQQASAAQAVQPALEMMVDGEEERRNGAAFAKSLNATHKAAVGEALDSDFTGALGDTMGQIFVGIRKAGAPGWISYMVLGLAILPATALVGWRVFASVTGKDEKEEKDK